VVLTQSVSPVENLFSPRLVVAAADFVWLSV
jgi:hypothetical protein